MNRTRNLLGVCLLWAGCTDALPSVSTMSDAPPPLPFDELPELTAPCDLDPPDRNGVVITTTDFSTGAIAVLDGRNEELRADLAITSSDAIPFWHDGRVYVVNRFQHDYIDVIDPALGFRSVGQFAIDVPEVNAPNPHSITFDETGLAMVPLFGAPRVLVLDLARAPADALVDSIPIGAYADDGNPEASLSVRCGDLLFVSIQQLDPGFNRTGDDALVAIDIARRQAVDLDPDIEGAQGWPLQGAWIRQLRRDPADEDGHTLLGLTTGIERIDLRTGEVGWAVSDQQLAEAGLVHFFQPQAFAVDASGKLAYLAAYSEAPDFEQVRLYRIGLDGHPPTIPEPFAEGLKSEERTLELIGDRLWYGSSDLEHPGLLAFDVSVDPPVLVSGPLGTGLPPYALTSVVLP